MQSSILLDLYYLFFYAFYKCDLFSESLFLTLDNILALLLLLLSVDLSLSHNLLYSLFHLRSDLRLLSEHRHLNPHDWRNLDPLLPHLPRKYLHRSLLFMHLRLQLLDHFSTDLHLFRAPVHLLLKHTLYSSLLPRFDLHPFSP